MTEDVALARGRGVLTGEDEREMLCILQDHKDTKHVHINEMGRIYNHAFVTIVAAAGGDAGYGLHGVSARRPLNNRWKNKWNFVRGNLVPLRGPWYWRGWTFQEDMLSPRALLFQEMMMVLKVNRIKKEAAKEDEADEEKRAFSYQEAVEDYTSRDIGDQRDAINAFTGVCNHYLGVGVHRFGMPLKGFDNAMHWMAWRGNCKRRVSSRGQPLFPSWCWASIRGPIQYPLMDSSIAAIASWAFVGKVHSDSTVSLVTPEPRVEWFRGDSWIKTRDCRQMRAATLACRFHCMPKGPPEVWRIDLAAQNVQQQFKTVWPTYSAFWKACRGINKHSNAQHPPYLDKFSKEQKSIAAARPGRILGVSQVATLTVGSRRGNDKVPEHIRICKGNKCVGIGYLDDSMHERLPGEAEVSFFALTTSGKSELGTIYGPGNVKMKAAHPSTRSDDKWPRNVVSAIAIRETHDGSGVFRRVGFGVISLLAWAKLKRERRSIVLE
ncbi:hypothetical protein IWX50DRAFT_613838 [Phyllosticta citricarpa]